MKKYLVSVIFVMIILSLTSCSGDNNDETAQNEVTSSLTNQVGQVENLKKVNLLVCYGRMKEYLLNFDR